MCVCLGEWEGNEYRKKNSIIQLNAHHVCAQILKNTSLQLKSFSINHIPSLQLSYFYTNLKKSFNFFLLFFRYENQIVMNNLRTFVMR